ncbi:MAG: hypothetical protein K1X82_09745 [Bacteroidia bacterium]|nr:hypothetical protein [Bacteroidia bacterium]
MKSNEIERFFNGLSGLSCLVIGDAMLDEYIRGSVERISPEAPVPIVKLTTREHRLGGAANVALNLVSLGVKTQLGCLLGKDEAGFKLEKLLLQNGIDNSGLFFVENRPTTIKTRVISSGHHLLRIDNETEEALSAELQQSFENHLMKLLQSSKPNLVIFEDYDKACLSLSLITKVIEYCKQNTIPVSVDPKYKNFKSYSGCSLFKPNFKELVEASDLSGLPKNSLSVEACLEKLHPILNAENYLITLSEKGVYYKNSYHQGTIPAHLRSITDVSGAGDSVIAVASCALALGFNLEFIASISNLAGGLVCEEVGVVPIQKEKLKMECQSSI